MKETAKRLALLSAALLVTLMIAHFLYGSIVEPEPVVPDAVGQYDETLGWALRPGASETSRATGAAVRYSINSHGLRDAELSYDKPEGTFRIVLLGDSRTFGYGVSREQHFSRLLEGYFSDLEVVNLGVSGYGVDQELLALRTRGLRYQPDLVIAYVAHFGDHRHVFAERFGRPKPLFQLQGEELVLTNVPVPRPSDGLDLAHRLDLALGQRSPLYRDASRAAAHLLQRIRGQVPASTPQASADGDGGLTDRLYQVALAILRQMEREASAAGARFVLVTQLPRLHREALDHRLTSFDVSDPLANPLFELPHDLQHINEAGNGVLAWELARFLTDGGLIPARLRRDGKSRPEAAS